MIGIFDSGVGGMTVARAIEQLCPGYPLIYFGDIARTPYGSKSPETIIGYSRNNTDFLLDRGAGLIVVACNSAASTASAALRLHYDVPVLDVIGPATRKAATISKNGRIGVIGTRATVKSGIYEQRIQTLLPGARIFSRPCPLLVPLVEEGWLSRRETKMILRRYLHPLRREKIDTLVLGCTHYPLLKHLIGPRIGRRVNLIDSSVEVALHVREFLHHNPELRERLRDNRAPSRFFVSDCTEPVRQLAAKIFGREILLEKVKAFLDP
ncbi:MAG: glutamate racemase [Deltaproteobacteria bacterium]|nr:glutamate racemase [Deltaproteobacteria bacterium]